jgi:hypothetical protein
MLAAEQTVYHNREHPSAVILPVSVLPREHETSPG